MSAPGAYWVLATKKGGLPLSTEKRKYGKPVTIVQGCGGDVPALLAAIKASLGTGGCVYGGTGLELQGSLAEQAGAWLVRSGCVRGLARPAEPAADAAGDDESGPSDHTSAREPRAKPRWSADRTEMATSQPAPAPLPVHEPDPYRSFCALMRSWPYWDQDWNRLPELWEAHLAAAGGGDVMGKMGGLSLGGGTSGVSGGGGGGEGGVSTRCLDDALRPLGMIAEACPSRQKRADRMRSRREGPARAPVGVAGAHAWAGVPPPVSDRHGPILDGANVRRLVAGSLGRGAAGAAPPPEGWRRVARPAQPHLASQPSSSHPSSHFASHPAGAPPPRGWRRLTRPAHSHPPSHPPSHLASQSGAAGGARRGGGFKRLPRLGGVGDEFCFGSAGGSDDDPWASSGGEGLSGGEDSSEGEACSGREGSSAPSRGARLQAEGAAAKQGGGGEGGTGGDGAGVWLGARTDRRCDLAELFVLPQKQNGKQKAGGDRARRTNLELAWMAAMNGRGGGAGEGAAAAARAAAEEEEALRQALALSLREAHGGGAPGGVPPRWREEAWLAPQWQGEPWHLVSGAGQTRPPGLGVSGSCSPSWGVSGSSTPGLGAAAPMSARGGLEAIEARLAIQREAWQKEAGQREAREMEGGSPSSGGRAGGGEVREVDARGRRLHVTCEELWGDLSEDEALALAMRLSGEEAEAREGRRREGGGGGGAAGEWRDGCGAGTEDGEWGVRGDASSDDFSLPSGDEGVEEALMREEGWGGGEGGAKRRGREAGWGEGIAGGHPEEQPRTSAVASAPSTRASASTAEYNCDMGEASALRLALALNSAQGGGHAPVDQTRPTAGFSMCATAGTRTQGSSADGASPDRFWQGVEGEEGPTGAGVGLHPHAGRGRGRRMAPPVDTSGGRPGQHPWAAAGPSYAEQPPCSGKQPQLLGKPPGACGEQPPLNEKQQPPPYGTQFAPASLPDPPDARDVVAPVACTPSLACTPSIVAAELESLAQRRGQAADGESVLDFLLSLPEHQDVADYLWDWLGHPADAVAADVCRLRKGGAEAGGTGSG
jgi:translation initiation factor 1 (eIF-1/SUI1)